MKNSEVRVQVGKPEVHRAEKLLFQSSMSRKELNELFEVRKLFENLKSTGLDNFHLYHQCHHHFCNYHHHQFTKYVITAVIRRTCHHLPFSQRKVLLLAKEYAALKIDKK